MRALEARLELAERALVYSNRNIQITTEILIQASEEVLPLLVERTENSANIAALIAKNQGTGWNRRPKENFSMLRVRHG